MKIEIEIISKEFIKPSSPTPQHLRHHHYSFIDQTQPHLSLSFIHFYSGKSSTNINFFERCNLLKNSLSEVLTIFYPVAGRVQNHNSCIDCNDEGVLFVEAKANCQLSDVLEDHDPNKNYYFTPFRPNEAGDLGGFSQVTLFSCGGFAITFGMAHKIGDGLSMFTFLNSWAAITKSKGSGNNTATDVVTAPLGYGSVFPSAKAEYTIDYGTMAASEKEKVVTKLFRFDKSSIAALRDKCAVATNDSGRRLSRVEALTRFILGRYMATTQTNNQRQLMYMVIQAVNLRPRMEPPLPERCFGNFSSGATMEANIDTCDEFCNGIVEKMKESATVVTEHFKNMKEKDQVFKFLKSMMEKFDKEEMISFAFSSLHAFDAYESDFGWGKPLWVGMTPTLFKNQVFFLGTEDGEGIEVQICLKEDDMAKFEIDNQLLKYVSWTLS